MYTVHSPSPTEVTWMTEWPRFNHKMTIKSVYLCLYVVNQTIGYSVYGYIEYCNLRLSNCYMLCARIVCCCEFVDQGETNWKAKCLKFCSPSLTSWLLKKWCSTIRQYVFLHGMQAMPTVPRGLAWRTLAKHNYVVFTSFLKYNYVVFTSFFLLVHFCPHLA